jgi:hypothetical protein
MIIPYEEKLQIGEISKAFSPRKEICPLKRPNFFWNFLSKDFSEE